MKGRRAASLVVNGGFNARFLLAPCGTALHRAAAPWGIPAQWIGEIGLWIAAVLTLVTGWDYFRRGMYFMAKPKAGETP